MTTAQFLQDCWYELQARLLSLNADSLIKVN
uniref:Uncharacterized protein n=1 Tax=Anguilla anguilla TaxID=7936 RepID=A0A0E9QUR3_ANGAN